MAANKDPQQPVMVTAMPRRVRFAFARAEVDEPPKTRRAAPAPIHRTRRSGTGTRDK